MIYVRFLWIIFIKPSAKPLWSFINDKVIKWFFFLKEYTYVNWDCYISETSISKIFKPFTMSWDTSNTSRPISISLKYVQENRKQNQKTFSVWVSHDTVQCVFSIVPRVQIHMKENWQAIILISNRFFHVWNISKMRKGCSFLFFKYRCTVMGQMMAFMKL